MTNPQSYLSKEESSAIKGLLIILIVLGHNMVFTYAVEKYQVMVYLYLFHIQTFFIIPFLYDENPLQWQKAKDLIVRFYVPYLWFFTIFFTGYFLIYKHGAKFDTAEFLNVLFTGNGMLLAKYVGFQLLWFLPAMLMTMLVKGCYYRLYQPWRGMMLAASLLSYFFLYKFAVKFDAGPLNLLPNVVVGFSLLSYGVMVRKMIPCYVEKLKMIWLMLFIILSCVYFYNYCVIHNFNQKHLYSWSYLVLTAIFPGIFIFLLYSFKKQLGRSTLLQNFGRLSMYIYMTHAFIGYLFFELLKRLDWISVLFAVIVQILILLISFSIALWVEKTSRFRDIVFPNSLTEFQNALIGKNDF